MTGQAAGQDAANARSAYLLGTASTGGAYHPVGVALSTLVKLKLLPRIGVDLTAINTDGSRQNIELIRRDDIQFAIISALSGHEARTGTGRLVNADPYDDLRAITTLWLSTDHLLVRTDAVESGTIGDFLGLKGRPVSLGRPASSTLLENRMLMGALGVDVEADFNLVELGYKESAEALAQGRIDGMSVSGGVPIGAVQDAFELLGDGVAALDINDDQLKQIDRARGIWQRVVIESGTYPGQNRDIFTVGTPNILAVRADVDEEVVYQITKTIFEELEYLHGLHSTTHQISLDSAVNNLPLPVHAGAERYFREKGVELPLPPMELDANLLARHPTVEEARAAANDGVVEMLAGTEGDTSTRIAAELATVLGSSDSGIRLLATNGGGIEGNLTDLLYLRGVDTALVRADVLNYALRREVYPTVENQVTYISEMFPEEVHLLVRSDIAELVDLDGKRVNLGGSGGGASITATIVLSQLGLGVEPTYHDPRVAIEKLKQGEIEGAFLVGGKPMPLLREIDDDSGLKLLALPAIDYFDSYRSSEFAGYDYPNLMRTDEVVPTIAARTALLTYAWRSDSQRYEALDAFSAALFQNLLTLQEDGYHPKWREVAPTANFAGWRRFPPASRWIDDNQGTARRIVDQGRSRVRQQAAGSINDGGSKPLLIGDSIDQGAEPESDADNTTQIGEASDAEPASATPDRADGVFVPTTPVIELSPNVEPAGNQPITNGASLNGSGGPATEATTTPRSASNLRTRTGTSNTPTF